MEIIRSEHYYLVEALEHIEPGHELFQQIKNELFKKTGYILDFYKKRKT